MAGTRYRHPAPRGYVEISSAFICRQEHAEWGLIPGGLQKSEVLDFLAHEKAEGRARWFHRSTDYPTDCTDARSSHGSNSGMDDDHESCSSGNSTT